ncbi:type II toxin-antitoxin system HicA family toxin [Vibrio harveyi]|nr:type II toxin-antitoxin system HicA family toxin [Vibrio harveyi]
MSSYDLIKLLKENGWNHVSTKGSHHKFKHPNFEHPIVIQHPEKDLGKGLVHKIKKQAGL